MDFLTLLNLQVLQPVSDLFNTNTTSPSRNIYCNCHFTYSKHRSTIQRASFRHIFTLSQTVLDIECRAIIMRGRDLETRNISFQFTSSWLRSQSNQNRWDVVWGGGIVIMFLIFLGFVANSSEWCFNNVTRHLWSEVLGPVFMIKPKVPSLLQVLSWAAPTLTTTVNLQPRIWSERWRM